MMHLVLISIALLILMIPLQLHAGLSAAHQNCKWEVSAQRQLSGCAELIKHHLHRYDQSDQAIIYYIRAHAKMKLHYDNDSINHDLARACDLGQGLACCELAGWYYEEYDWNMTSYSMAKLEKLEAKIKRLLERAENLGINEAKCEKVFGYDVP